LRRHCGAVVVKDRRILATGYNGTPRNLRHCEEVGCLREQRGVASGSNHELCRGIHAEQNAVVQAALYGVAIDGAVIYSTHQPCVLCAKILINAGMSEIVYADPYPDPLSEEMLSESGVGLRRHGVDGPATPQ
jgi:dCMP deaminase